MSQRYATLAALMFAGSMLAVSAMAAQTIQPLPPNYRTIFDNPDLLVMRVHYGPHEFVPMHDHSAYPTVYVYLNNSGVVRIDHEPAHEPAHEGASEPSVNRPPTHTGAFRISPGVAERHSVTNLDDKPSDFLRVELKRIPPDEIKDVFRGSVPRDPKSGASTEFKDAALQIDRILCAPAAPCTATASPHRSLLVPIGPAATTSTSGAPNLQPGEVLWLPANKAAPLSPGAQVLRVLLLFP